MQYVAGDFVAVAQEIAPADLVALDRVICCYPDMASLVGRSASLARRRYGLVYPRDTWLSRVGIRILNLQFRLTRSPFRAYVHRTAEVEAIVASHGLVQAPAPDVVDLAARRSSSAPPPERRRPGGRT